MGVAQTVIDRLAQWAVRKSSYAPTAPRIGDSGIAGMPLWAEWSTKRAVNEGYKAHYALYAVASDLAGCVRSPPWALNRRTKDGAEVVDNHPLAEMVRRPNRGETWGGLLEAWDLFKSLAGNALGRVIISDSQVLAWKLRPDRMKPIPDKNGYIVEWEYQVGGQSERFPAEEILHFKFFDPGSDHWGMAPLQAAAHLVDTANSGITSNKSLVNNMGRPAGMFNPSGKVPPMSEKQRNQWEKSINKHMTGPKNTGKFLVNPFEAEFQQYEFSPVELDYLNSFVAYENGIYKAFHVLPEAMGAEATYENKRWAMREKWSGPVNSRLREMRGVLNLFFAEAFGTAYPPAVGDIYLDFDLTDTPAVIEARKEMFESAAKIWAMGVPFDSVDRQMDLGFGPQVGGDVGYIDMRLVPAGASAPTDLSRQVRAVDFTKDQLAAHWRATETRKQGWVRGVAEKVKVLFAAERRVVVKAVKDGSLDVSDVVDAGRSKWEELLTAVFRAVIEDFGDQVAAGLFGERAVRTDFDPWDDLIQAWVNEKTLEHVDYIAATTKTKLRKLVLEGIDEGQSISQIARSLDEQYIDWTGMGDQAITTSRAYTIARTEVHCASGFAMHESARQSGVVDEKHWLDAGDERVRDAHAGNTAAGWLRFDEVYPNGAMYPGDGTDDVNCRCTEMYRSR